MNSILKYNICNIVIAIAMTMFFSCNNRLNDVQNIGVSENEPIGVAENLNLKHTVSGRLESILVSPKMLDYSNRDFSFSEFPEGIDLTLFDDENNKSTVVADYAIIYNNNTNLIDLQGNVVLSTHTKDTLFAEQLFYDRNKNWLFTNQPVTYRTGIDLIHGNGFDSDKNFNQAEVLEINGIITLEE
jgi:LPS export ABC transporter protein LptC